MSTFTYSPTDSVTIAPNGDVSVTDGATTTTYSKGGATKTVTKNPPDPNPPPPENPVSKKTKNGDVTHTYTDLTQNPPVTTKITFHPNGDVEIVVTKGQDKTKIDINNGTGVRRTKTWTEPNPEPAAWGKTDNPTSIAGPAGATTPAAPAGGASTAPVGSPTPSGGNKKKPKKKVKRRKAGSPAGKRKPTAKKSSGKKRRR